MAMVNIPSTCDDPAYRYKMPRLVAQKQSSGNGKQTAITNISKVAQALNCPPDYILKWFGVDLVAQTNYTNKAGEGERAIVKGHIDTAVFQNSLDGFIQKYVCCQQCGLPEILMRVKKGLVCGSCRACGWQDMLDNDHKVAAYIRKDLNPTSSDNKALDKKARREAKAKKRAEQAERDGNSVDDDEDTATASFESGGEEPDKKKENEEKAHKDKKDRADRKENKVKREKKEKKDKKEKKEKKKEEGNDDADDREKYEDAKAQKEERKKKDRKDKNYLNENSEKEKKHNKDSNGMKDANDTKQYDRNMDPDVEDSDKRSKQYANNFEYLHEFDVLGINAIIGKINSFVIERNGQPTADELFDEVRMEQLAQGFDHRVRLYIVMEALCGTTMDEKSVRKHKKHYSKFICQGKMEPSDILWAFGVYYSFNPGVLNRLPLVLKCFYEEDWLEEQDILSFYDQENGKVSPAFEETKEAATPFVEWLKKASSDDGDDEDSD